MLIQFFIKSGAQNSIVFSPDGRYLATESFNKTLLIDMNLRVLKRFHIIEAGKYILNYYFYIFIRL